MKRKMILMSMLCCLMTGMLCGCGKDQASSVEEERYVTVQEVCDRAAQDMEDAYSGKYEKLSFASFTPEITTEGSISELRQQRTQYGEKDQTAEQCIKHQYDYICQWLGVDSVDPTKITDAKTEKTLDEVEKMLKKGTYPDELNVEDGFGKPALLYQDEKGTRIYLDSGLCGFDVFMDNAYTEDITYVRTYEANAEDGSLEDAYPLEDGECKVSEAIAFAEKYQNEERPIRPGKDFSIEAEQVRVYQLQNGKYGFDILMHRVYRGIPFIGLYQGTSISSEEYEFDMGIFFMTNREKPSACMGLGANEIMTKRGKTYTELIPLSRVFELLNERMGNNAKCNVLNAGLSYLQKNFQRKFTKYGYCDTIDAEPVWYVEVESGTDERRTKFFIGLQDYEGKNIRTLNVQ